MNNESEEQSLTLKQRKFVAGYLEGKPMVQAAAEAGYAASTGARGATELLRSPKVRTAIQEALEKAGVTDERLYAIINEGLGATRTAYIIHEGQIKTLASPDWAMRHRFVDTVLKLKSVYPSTGSEDVGESYELRVLKYRRGGQALNPK